jgi:hypothetical protein
MMRAARAGVMESQEQRNLRKVPERDSRLTKAIKA